MDKKRKLGGGRKPSKPDYNPSTILQKQMDTAAALYAAGEHSGTNGHPSLQMIAEKLHFNPIKVRKLLITAGVYESEIANQVQRAFNTHKAAGLTHRSYRRDDGRIEPFQSLCHFIFAL